MTAKNVSLLHISDVHFGCSDDAGTQERVLDALQGVLEVEGHGIDVVVFTGDLTQRSASTEYVQAQDWLVRLHDVIKAPILLVPGNHDVDRTRADLKVLRAAYHDSASYAQWKTTIFKSHEHLQPFLGWFSAAKRDSRFLLNNWQSNPAVDTVDEVFGGVRCRFICVNTALLSCDNHDKGKLCVDIASVNSPLGKRANETNLVILVGHHPSDELAPWNRDELEKVMGQETGPHLYLHGHVHDQKGTGRYLSSGHGLVTITGGAAYPDATYRKFFSIVNVDLELRNVLANVFEYSEESGKWLPQPQLSRPIPARLPKPERCTVSDEDLAVHCEASATQQKVWKNPFADVAANGLKADEVRGLFVEQAGPLARLQNHVDTIVEGQRGTGKTMLLRYLSVPVQCSALAAEAGDNFDAIREFRSRSLPFGIYCCLTNAGVNRSDSEILKSGARETVVFEHITALFIICRIISALKSMSLASSETLLSASNFTFLCRLLRVTSPDFSEPEHVRFSTLLDEAELQRMAVNEHLASLLPGGSPTKFNPWLDLTYTLSSVIERIQNALQLTAPVFLLLDDFDQLAKEQQEILFNAAASRRHSIVCYKFGIMSEGQKAFMSAAGRTYREGDDYNFVRLDWVDESLTQYIKIIDEIVERRLKLVGWPAGVNLATLLDNWTQGNEYRDEAKKIAEVELGSMPENLRNDKLKEIWERQANARYFKLLAKKRVYHRYAGKMTIIQLSSGIFRQFLELCSGIIDLALADPRWNPASNEKIGAEKQNRAVREWSKDMYRHLSTSGDVSTLTHKSQVVRNQHLMNLANALSRYFQAKLVGGGKNPDAIAVSITGTLAPDSFAKALLDVAVRESVLQRKAIDYTSKSGSGDRFPTYRLNRRLAPSVGLGVKDPHGRHELSAHLIELAATKPDAFLLQTVGSNDDQALLQL